MSARRVVGAGLLVVVLAVSAWVYKGSRISAGPGPLISTNGSGGGGISVLPPTNPGPTWTATFGDVLCVEEDAEARILSLEARRTVRAPLALRLRVRTWNPSLVGGLGSKVGGVRGLDGRMERVPGASVTVGCDDTDVRQELLITMETDAGGAALEGVVIDYVSDGERFSRPVNWVYVLCGSQVPREYCRNL